jgi:CRISPR-associated endonuclease/helicase Cas3
VLAEATARLAAALGNDPFPWQVALLERFLKGELPDALDVPTGLGKTAVMAIWLIACWSPAPRPEDAVSPTSPSPGVAPLGV